MPRLESLVALPPSVDPSGWWYLVDPRGAVLVDEAGVPPRFGESPLEGTDAPILLGLWDGVATWALGVEVGAVEDQLGDLPAGFDWQPLRSLGMRIDTERWMLAGRAVQLVEWARTSRYCGRCATATERSATERACRCPRCGLTAYPRLAPAIIVIIERGDEILLGQGRGFGGKMYSALAGFVEPGESLEETVRREVREEVGVEVDDIRYFASQPWPFPHSLMIGFFARWTSGAIAVDGEEIVDAQWFRAGSLPDIPPSISIARALIDDWLARRA